MVHSREWFVPVPLELHMYLETVNDISNDISNLITLIHQHIRLLPYSQTTNKTIKAAAPLSAIFPWVTLTPEKLTLRVFPVIFIYTSEIAKTKAFILPVKSQGEISIIVKIRN